MKKKWYLFLFPIYRNRKIFGGMLALLLVCMLQMTAIGASAQKKVSLTLKGASIEQVFREIKRHLISCTTKSNAGIWERWTST